MQQGPATCSGCVKVVARKCAVALSSNLGEVNTLLYDNKYGFDNNKYDFNKYRTRLCGNFILTFKSQDFKRLLEF